MSEALNHGIICGSKLIFDANKFDPKTDIKVIELNKKSLSDQSGRFQYTTFINNTHSTRSNGINLNVYISSNKIKFISLPIIPYNAEKQTFFKGKRDPNRHKVNIYIDKTQPNLVSLRNVYKKLDDYMTSDEFKDNFFKIFGYNESNKSKFKFDYNYILKEGIVDDSQPEDTKKPFQEYDNIKIKFDVGTEQKDKDSPISVNSIKTLIYKHNKETGKNTRISIKNLDDIEKILHKNAEIKAIIRLQKFYCSKPAKKGPITSITYGFSSVFEQIIIYDSGDSYANGDHSYINIDGEDEEEIEETETSEEEDNSSEEKIYNPTAPKDVDDEPTDSEEQEQEQEESDENEEEILPEDEPEPEPEPEQHTKTVKVIRKVIKKPK